MCSIVNMCVVDVLSLCVGGGGGSSSRLLRGRGDKASGTLANFVACNGRFKRFEA